MKLNYDRKSKDPTYFIQVGIRNGKKVTTKNIERIGKHSELLKITDDPLAYAKKRVKEVNDKINKSKVEYHLTLDFDEKLVNGGNTISDSTCSNIGYFYLKKLYDSLDLFDYFNEITKGKKIHFDPSLINMTLSLFRILNPGSKLHTFNHLHEFYGQFDISHQDILRFMDILNDNYDSYLSHLFDASNKLIKRNKSVCYFDCTNFYFEKEEEDEDVYDEVTGEYIKGLLKYGVSKEHRPNPIVQMGLFMDGDGVPLSMCINSGSDNESLCAVPSEKKLLDMFKDKDIIYCADAGLGYSDIRLFNDFAGRRFVVTQSIKKLSDTLKTAVFNDFDYRFFKDGKKTSLEFMKTFDKSLKENREYYDGYIYKSIPVDKEIELGLFSDKKTKDGKIIKIKDKGVLKQRIIVTYSRKMAEYQRTVRNRQIERAKKILENMDPETFKKGPNDVKRFIKSDQKNTYCLDEERIKEEEKYDGFYAIATNIFDMPEKEVIAIQSRRYKIEDCFRILKSQFNSRPVYHRLSSRIKAHFLICFTALLIYRLLEVKLDKNATHFTPCQIIDTLKNMNVVNCQDIYYQSCYTGSNVLDCLEQLFDLKLNRKYYLPKTLNKYLKKL